MTPTATDDLTPDLVERVHALSPAAKDKLFHLLLDEEQEFSNEPVPWASEELRLAWKEEIARRITAYLNGEVKAIPAEEVIALLEADQREDERRAG
jgi:hypothetical protein